MKSLWLDRLSGKEPGWAATPLAGLTNRSFRLQRGDETVVVRLPGAGTERYIDRRAELHNHDVAARLGIAPAILLADPDCLVTRYVEGTEPLTPETLREPATLSAVGRLLARLHRSGELFQGRMALFPKTDQYLCLAGDETPAALRRLCEIATPARPILADPRVAWVPSHIDPSPANFLRSAERLSLIDWEYSAMCDPAWDLAGLVIEAGLGEGQRRSLLDAYGVGDERLPLRVELFRALLHLVAASWAAAQIATAEDRDGYRRLAEDYTRRAEPLIAGPGFAALVAALR
ncbi:MAG TPA: choline/ethanolamine kinase family protein [Hypericibacter adhaerens]|uniref:choline/ethanolamine kinase family protein n=1 Tax=Hypericibacter adhaerens TaxID=2602016 RepID=UPI002B8B6D85|nr:choline/ethanolamine kinase family protein [Hypericibacter adhaerens]HWA46301.1 choline/ethanolamine kinase family protein [Hypericibacter adhaerens]